MKSSLLLCACTGFSLLAGCDSGSSPTQTEVIRDTVRIYPKDRFSGNSTIVHGRWVLRSDKDSADLWIFQDTSRVEAIVQWTKSSSWTVAGTRNDNGWDLLSKDGKIELLLKVTEEKDDKVNKMNVNVINRNTSDLFTAAAERRL